jgi:hypothetical protein
MGSVLLQKLLKLSDGNGVEFPIVGGIGDEVLFKKWIIRCRHQ